MKRLIFFFKQKTSYEMRISDWSSDVCSSDLDTGGSGAPAQEEEVLEPITPLFAAADPAAGEQLASRQCATCHTFNEGGAARVGPNLYDIVAHPIAAEGGFRYSSGLSDNSGDTWTYENLKHFLHDPRDFATGTKMTFTGFAKPEDIHNTVANPHPQQGSKQEK